MRASRTLVFCLAILICVFVGACGGGGSTPPPPPGAPVITSDILPQASVNVPYSFYVQAQGGTGTYTWAISGGSLPPGLSFSSMTAQISGTPTGAGSFTFTVKVTDAASMSGTKQLTLMVTGALVITCNSCLSGTMTLPTGTPGVPYSATFTASGGVGAYSWCIIETNGNCDDGSGGALPAGLTMGASTGMITGTPTTPTAPMQIMVFVHDSEIIESRGSTSVSLSIFGVVTSSLPTGQIYVPYSQALTLSGGVGPYSWCVMESGGGCDNGSGGALPPGLSLAATCTNTHLLSCTLSGTPSQAGTFPFVVQVTDSEHPPSSSTAQFSINISGITNALLNGHYAFALNGFKNGSPFVMASAFVADGNGNLTAGFLDLNDGSGEIDNHGNVVPQSLTTGSVYNLNADGTGTLTMVTNKPATYQFEIVASSNACTSSMNMSACGQIIVRDPNNPAMYGSGVLKVQDSTYFAEHQFFPGNFALRVEGTDPSGNRYAAAGALSFNSGTLVDIDCSPWGLNGCPLDQDDSGQVFSNTMRGSFSPTIDAMTGRGNFADVSFPNDPNNLCLGTLNNFACAYAYYIINRTEMILMSANPISKPANLTVWSAFRQLGGANGWQLTALSGAGVAQLTALDPSGGNPKADVIAGLLNADGAGNATFNSDENDGGTLNQQQTSQGTYAIDSVGQNTGKVTLSGFSTQFGNNPPILYLYGPNSAYFVGTDSKVTSGVLQLQTNSPFDDGSVKGVYAGGTVSPTLSSVTDSVVFLFADGLGNFNGAQYISGPGGPGGPNMLTLSYDPVDSTGRAVVKQGMNTFGFLYVVSSSRFVMVPVGNNPALNVFVSGPGT